MNTPVKPVLGGLNTKMPPVMLLREQSPDAISTVLRDGVVKKRGGFVPLFKDRMKGDAVENVAWRTIAALDDTGSGVDGDYVTSPGFMVAGHRAIYEQVTSLAVSLWFTPTSLIARQGGNAQTNALASFWPAPFTVQVLPIISKGPTHKFFGASPAAVGNQWGAHAEAGMPFCVYMFNSGSGTAPVWSFRLSAHVLVAGNWTLQTAISTVPVEVGGRYHIIAGITGGAVGLRIARVRDGETSTYVENVSAPYAGTVAWNRCPIQVFDCPMRFVGDTTVGSATQRPGLGLTTAASGGWWYGRLRPEGKVDGIEIWKDPVNLDLLQRTSKLPFTNQVGLIGLWNMRGDAEDYVREETGRGNHLFFVPRGPVTCQDDGGKEGGSWFYNGTTSYALLDVDGPNWRYADETTKVGAFSRIVRDNFPHGMAVEFWVDSIEPEVNQVICEIHSVLRLEIDANGKLLGYCRDGDNAHPSPANTLAAIGGLYQGPVTSDLTVQAGRRYAVALLRRDGGTILDLYVDGVLHKSLAGLRPNNYAVSPSNGNSHPPSGITIGMGSYERMIRSPGPNDFSIAETFQINTDSRTGFVGRVETFRIVTTPNMGALIKRHGPEDAENWRFSDARTFQNPVGSNPAVGRDFLVPTDPADPLRTQGKGGMPAIATQRFEGEQVLGVYLDSFGYQLSESTARTNHAVDKLGHEVVNAVGSRIYFTLGYWRFNEDDRDIDYAGAYVKGLEYRYTGSTVLTDTERIRHPAKHTHVQFSFVEDQTGFLGAAERRCSEGDVMTDDALLIISGNPKFYTHRLLPYGCRSPAEIGLRWAAGIAPSEPGTTPVTLLEDYDVQTEGRRLVITACGRQLYWAKPAWDNGSLLFAGGTDSYVLARIDPDNEINAVGTATKTIVQFTCRVKPMRLDGVRMIACKRSVSSPQAINWMVYADNGSIAILGCESTTAVWRFVEGQITGAPADVSRSNSLKVGVWNHIAVRVGPGSAQLWVNGQFIALVNTVGLTGANQTSAWGSAASVLPAGEFYLGGSPEGRSIIALPFDAPTLTLTTESWYGFIEDVQVGTTADTTRFPDGLDGFPPAPFTETATALYRWPMDEGDGWLLRNTVEATEEFAADVQIREFFQIAQGLRQETDRRFNAVAFRDRLIVTNGAANPQRIAFRGFDTTTPFVVQRLGIAAPVAVDVLVTPTTTPGPGPITDGLYLVTVSFLNAEGLESEPTQIGEVNITGGPFGSLILLVEQLPRSPDSQVVARRLYVSGVGGGTPVLNRDVHDNDSSDCTLTVYTAAGVSPVEGEQLPAPRARHCAIAGSSLVLADLPEQPAGQNAVAFSTPDEIDQFTVASSAILIDSEDGKPLVGIAHNLGVVFLSKRDSIHQISVGAIVQAINLDAAIRLNQPSEGIGGATAAAGNLLYGSCDRGVFFFNNSEPFYLSDPIEPTWRTEIDRSNIGLYVQTGAFMRAFSQYVLSVRRQGVDANDTILVVDLLTKGWMRWSVLEHAIIRTLERDQSQILAMGTNDGRVLQYADDIQIEGTDDQENRYGEITLQADGPLDGTATSISLPSGNFSTVLAGLQCVEVLITYNNGTLTARRRLTGNTKTTISWDEPLEDWESHTSFIIGAYDGYWTTPWIHDGPMGVPQKMVRCAVEMLPAAGNLQVDISCVMRADAAERQWPTDPKRSERFLEPMENGYTQRPPQPKAQASGQYHRVRFGTYGIRDGFGLIGFQIDLEPSSSRDTTGRTS